MIGAVIDNLPAICVGGLGVLSMIAVWYMLDTRPMTDRRWAKLHQAQRKDLERIRRRGSR